MLNDQISHEISEEPEIQHDNGLHNQNHNFVNENSHFYVIKNQLRRDYIILNLKRNFCYFIIIFACIILLGYLSKVMLWNDNQFYENKLIGRNSSIFNNFESFICHIDLGLILFCVIFLIHYCSILLEKNCFNHLNVRYDDSDSDFHLIRA